MENLLESGVKDKPKGHPSAAEPNETPGRGHLHQINNKIHSNS